MATRIEFPFPIILRRKDVIGSGLVSEWRFRRAVRERRLVGCRLLAKKYARYRRDAVMAAFGLRPCSAAGRPMSPFTATHVEVT
jgi:hypothetical protein